MKPIVEIGYTTAVGNTKRVLYEVESIELAVAYFKSQWPTMAIDYTVPRLLHEIPDDFMP